VSEKVPSEVEGRVKNRGFLKRRREAPSSEIPLVRRSTAPATIFFLY
jgi:hypothetical protein